MLRNLLYGTKAALALLLVTFLVATPSHAQSADPFAKKVFLVSMAKNGNAILFTDAVFCSVGQGGAYACGKNGAHGRQLEFKRGLKNLSLLDFDAGRGNPAYYMTSTDPKAGGRYAMVAARVGNRYRAMTNVAYFFDAKPGTIYIVYSPSMTAKEGVAKARELLSAHENFGTRLAKLDFQPIQAAQLSCTGKKRNPQCTLGQQIDPRQIGKTIR